MSLPRRAAALAVPIVLTALGGYLVLRRAGEPSKTSAGVTAASTARPSADLAETATGVRDASRTSAAPVGGSPRRPQASAAAPDGSWAGTVWPRIAAQAEIEAGRPIRPAERAALLRALERQRRARKRLKRAERSGDAGRIAEARERFLAAALEADAVSQALFGVPMATFVLHAEGEEIEEAGPR